MTFTKVKNWYNEFNAKYFNDELEVILEITTTRKIKRRLGDYSMRGKLRLHSAPLAKMTEADWKGTLIHEMVHAFLHKNFGWRNAGHNSRFHAKLGSIMREEFGIRYDRNRYHQKGLGKVATPAPTPKPEPRKVPATPVAPTGTGLYRVISTGKVGTFVKETTIYGKKHFTLKIEGMLFPFTVPADNAERMVA
jgi:predicted SprT family Zn-dependent metalloprotease